MNDAILVKEVGRRTAISVLSHRANFEYPGKFNGASSHVGPNHNEIRLHLIDGESKTIANGLLSDIALPTVVTSGLQIITNVGQLIVNDLINIVASSSDIKGVLVCIGINDTNGAIEIFALEKTTEEFGDLPAGKTFVTNLVELSVLPAGSTLDLIKTFIR